MGSAISLLAAAEVVEQVSAWLRTPVEIVETVLWSGLATGLGLATLHLITMLVTRWGDRSIGWKSLMFSLLVHLSCVFGLVAVNPPEHLLTDNEDKIAVVIEKQIEIQSKLTHADERVTLPNSGNTRVWEKLPDAPNQELIRTSRSPTEIKSSEGPPRTPGPITAPDIQVTEKSALPDQPDIRPELKQTGEKAAVRVEAVAPLKIDDPTAESRAEVRTPTLPPVKRTGSAATDSDLITRQLRPGSIERPGVTLGATSPIVSQDYVPSVPSNTSKATEAAKTEGGPRRMVPAPSSVPFNQSDEPASATGQSSKGNPSGSPTFSQLRTRVARGQETGGMDSFHPERKAQAPMPTTGNSVAVREGIRTELPNEGITPRPSRPNFDASKLGRRTTIPSIYEGRNLARRRDVARKYGGTDASEKAVELSLRWLAMHQNPEGFWDADNFDLQCPDSDRCIGHAGLVKLDEEGNDRNYAGKHADTGVTALALLAFLGAGYTHEEGQYADQIDRTVGWLLRQQRNDGYLGGNATHFEQMYCHAMATYALAEALSMQSDLSSDSRLRQPLVRAVTYIIDNQNPDGGWRYVQPKASGLPPQSSDMSMFGWQLMALKSAEIAGIATPESTKAKMVLFLKDRSQGASKGLAGYRIAAGQQLPPTESMTAESLFCKQILGISRDNPACTEAVSYMLQRPPRPSTHNIYYWYYGTLAMYQYGGSSWNEWNEHLRETLIAEQQTKGHKTGSWDPKPPWGPYGGRVFSTAISTLCLEVYYRFLPLYQIGVQNEPPTTKNP